MTKEGRWSEMIETISDDMLDIIGVSGTPQQVGAAIRARNDFAQRVSLVLYNETEAGAVSDILRAIRDPS